MNLLTELRYKLGFTVKEHRECFLRDRDRVVKHILRYRLLRAGSYEYNCEGEKVGFCLPTYMAKFRKMFGNARSIDKIFLSLITKNCLFLEFDGEYCGDAVVLTVSGCKVFDYRECLIYTFLDVKSRKKAEKAENIFSKYLPSTVIEIREDVIIERLIEEKESSKFRGADRIAKYCRALSDLDKYYQEVLREGKLAKCCGGCGDKRKEIVKCGDERLLRLYDKLVADCQFRDELPIVLCHGDFHTKNFIYDGEKQYYIDYDCMCHYQVFMDIFCDFFSGGRECGYVLFEGNSKVYESLGGIFNTLGLSFERLCIKEYLKRYLITFIDTRISEVNYGRMDRKMVKTCFEKVRRAMRYLN